MSSALRDSVEAAAQNTLPIPLSVSGLSFLGVTLQDWVFVGTAILVIFQLIVMAPKALRILKSLINYFKRKTIGRPKLP